MNKKRYIVFFDFDNTITTIDVIDDMLERFSVNDKWVELEDQWKSGKIGSRKCLEGQLGGIRIPKERLDRYLDHIRIDPYFKRLLRLLRSKRIKTIVLSDDFDYILKRILKRHGIGKLKIYSNRLKVEKDRLLPSFPSTNKGCAACAHCKNNNLVAHAGNDHTVIYIGDGRSDICPSEYADIVFAKGYLRDYFRKKRMPHIPFRSLKDIYNHVKRSVV